MRIKLITLAVYVLLFAIEFAPAQDIGTPDSCRFEPQVSSWDIYSEADSLFMVELWAWTDDPNLLSVSLRFTFTTASAGPVQLNYPCKDSVIVADTFFVDAELGTPVFTFQRMALNPDYPAFQHDCNGFTLLLLRIPPPLMPVNQPVKLGVLRLKAVDPRRLVESRFDIAIDSSSTETQPFKFGAMARIGFPPVYDGASIEVHNDVLDAVTTAEPIVIPEKYELEQNHPNPFNASTTIGFYLPSSAYVTVAVYNLLGQEVSMLVDSYLRSGRHEVRWDGTFADGSPAPSGLYFYRLEAGNVTDCRKMLLLK